MLDSLSSDMLAIGFFLNSMNATNSQQPDNDTSDLEGGNANNAAGSVGFESVVAGAAKPPITLAVTLGDPAGVGPEVVLKALADQAIAQYCVVVGCRDWAISCYESLRSQGSEAIADPRQLRWHDSPLSSEQQEGIQLGKVSAAAGDAAFRWLDQAIALTQSGLCQGVVTAPIAKIAWKAAGHYWPGQTEVLANRAGCDRFAMMFVARSPHTDWPLRVLLATTHIPLQAVPEALTSTLLDTKLSLLIQSLRQDFGIVRPHIAISGLNPHSGEGGQLGVEERDRLEPWLNRARQNHPDLTLTGLTPPDTLWVNAGRAWFDRHWLTQQTRPSGTSKLPDAYLALYHDQGLIPVKLMGFDRAVNTTTGLPFIRTSPDHGTAFDIAGQGIADATSMKAALEWGVNLARQRLHLESAR
ncbi:MAG: 4-hydroxythreonine-4-phosphate dehydrogenase PdxA [Cyanobacteria bacterium P01_D01_bin.73]